MNITNLASDAGLIDFGTWINFGLNIKKTYLYEVQSSWLKVSSVILT